MQYKNWTIEKNVKPIPLRDFDYDFWHDDFDGENGLCGTAKNEQDAIGQIEEMEE